MFDPFVMQHVLMRMTRGAWWLQDRIERAYQQRDEVLRLRRRYDKKTRAALEEPGYIELRRGGHGLDD